MLLQAFASIYVGLRYLNAMFCVIVFIMAYASFAQAHLEALRRLVTNQLGVFYSDDWL